MASILQRSFAGGELSPSLAARADQVKYQTGLNTCRNFLVQRHGGVANRPGTRFVAEVKNSSDVTRLFKFVFSDSQTYVMEFGHLYIRWHSGGAPVVVTSAAAWSGATAYVAGDLVASNNVYYYCVLGHTNQVPPNATYWYALTGQIYEIPSPYPSADLDLIHLVQTADIVTIACENHRPRELKRTAHTTWVLSGLVFGVSSVQRPQVTSITGTAGTVTLKYTATAFSTYGDEESSAYASTSQANLTAPSSGTPVTVNWSSSAGASGYRIYREISGLQALVADVGAGITSWIDTGVVPDLAVQPPDENTLFDSLIDASTYPRIVSVYQQRTIYGNIDGYSESLFAMQTGLPRNHTISTPIVDTDAITWSMRGKQVNQIRHLVDLGTLLILTSGGIWSVEGDANGVLTPTAINPRQRVFGGVAEIAPVVIGSTLLYVQARRTIIRDLQYSVQSDGYAGNDLTVFASHLFDGYQIIEMDWQQIPHSILWVVRDDGGLLGLTYLPEHQLWGWHRHDTDGLFERVCTVPEGIEDVVYVIVKRTINGVTKRYVERFASRLVSDVVADAWFVDSGLEYDGTNLTTTTMTVSGGTTWVPDEELTLTASPDGTTWTERANPKNVNLFGVTHGNGLFVAVGSADTDAYLITSPDGITWTERVNPKAFGLLYVAYGAGLFVAVGVADGTDAYLITSPDGITWTERANPKNITLRAVAYGAGLFVAVGSADGTDAYIVTSPDGITWTERANPKNVLLEGLVFGGGLFVAVGDADGTDAYLITSADGITWTERANPKNVLLYGVTYGNNLFVAVGAADGTDAYLVTSADGITWTERANPKNVQLTGVAYSSGLYVAVGLMDGSTDTYLLSSPDAITWTERTAPKNISLNGVVQVNAFFVAVGNQDTGTDAYMLTSGLYFSAAEIGNEIRLTNSTDSVRLRIATHSGGNAVKVFANKTVPTAFRTVTTASWIRAVDQVAGLSHLEGKTVNVFADGFVETPQVVSGGLITLQAPYGLIRVGLPITADLETLDIDLPGAQSLLGKPKLITEITLVVERSRGIFVGPDTAHLQEYAPRSTESYDALPTLVSGPIKIPLQSTWNSHGRIVVRQTDPLPITVLGAMPTGLVSTA